MDRLFLYKKMHAILSELGMSKSKEDLLAGYHVAHTRDLCDADLLHLVNRLVRMKDERLTGSDLEKRKWRSNLMTLLNRYGIYVTNNDWTAVNKLLLDERLSGKLMYEMNVEELQNTFTRLQSILHKIELVKKRENKLSQLN